MNHQQLAFRRKIIYIVAIGLLLFPLVILGQPATTSSSGDGSAGGVLAQLRTDNDLSQANLSEIDPASETMKLATLGFRGVAANILWEQANEYKMKKNWDKLSVTLNQIIKIQPNFMSVWEFQAHNLSYNVSVEFDDYQYRYHWVKKGMYFLMSGIAYNKRDYKIFSNLGFFFGQKLGKSDERRQFRRMFRKDVDFHSDLAEHVEIDDAQGQGGTDNWLVSYLWYKLAENMVLTDPNVKIGTRSELMFFKESPSMLRNYAIDLEEEFEPGERARFAWERALLAWREFGQRQIRTSAGTLLVLRDEDRIDRMLDELRAELDSYCPGIRDELRAQKLAELSAEELSAYNRATLSPEELREIDEDDSMTPDEKRFLKRRLIQIADWEMTFEDREFANSAKMKMQISDSDVLDEINERAPENKEEALRKYLEIADYVERLQWVSNYQGQVNYRYWDTRALSEAQPTTVQARASMYNGRRLENQTILDQYPRIDDVTGLPVINQETGEPVMEPGARQLYEESFRLWREILREYPDLVDDVASGVMLAEIENYYQVLQDLGVDWPLDFPLQFLIDRYRENQESPVPSSDELEARRLFEEPEQGTESDGTFDNTRDPLTGGNSQSDDQQSDDQQSDGGSDADASDDTDAADDSTGGDDASQDGTGASGSGDAGSGDSSE